MSTIEPVIPERPAHVPRPLPTAIGELAEGLGDQLGPTLQRLMDNSTTDARAAVTYLRVNAEEHGLDVLHVTTHEMDRSLRGTTLGLSAQAGVLGTIGDTLVYRYHTEGTVSVPDTTEV